MKRIGALILAAALALSLCAGCLDPHSLDRYGYVLAIGFDRGETLPYNVTLALQKTQIGTDGRDGGGFKLVSAECNDLFEAIETLSGALPFTLDFARTMMLVFEQSLVMEDNTLERLLSVSFSRLRIRYNANVFVSLGKAEEAIQGMENELDPSLSKIEQNYLLYAANSGMTPVTNLTMLFETFDGGFDAIVPLCGKQEEKAERRQTDSVGVSSYAYIGGSLLVKSDMKTGLAGAALFSGWRMVGLIDGQRTQLLLMARGDFKGGRIRLTDGNEKALSIYVTMNEPPAITVSLGKSPRAEVRISLLASLELPESLDEKRAAELTTLVRAKLESGFSELFGACRRLESDAMGFGRHAIKQFATAADWESCDWKAVYSKMEAAFTVDVKMAQAADKTILE